jgi:hypothetical protein
MPTFLIYVPLPCALPASSLFFGRQLYVCRVLSAATKRCHMPGLRVLYANLHLIQARTHWAEAVQSASSDVVPFICFAERRHVRSHLKEIACVTFCSMPFMLAPAAQSKTTDICQLELTGCLALGCTTSVGCTCCNDACTLFLHIKLSSSSAFQKHDQ